MTEWVLLEQNIFKPKLFHTLTQRDTYTASRKF
jgi:hypothetical protein